jgi:hypothetical protein
VATVFSMHAVWPGVHTAARHAPPWQYWPVGQSVVLMQRTHDPVERSHSIPSGVQVRSDMHLSSQLLATQVLVVSRQSASVTHATQRPAAVLQTSPLGQSSELLHVVYGTHFRAVQSLLAGQSLAVTQSTHMAIAGSQTCSPWQSRLLRQPGGGIPPSPPVCFLLLLQPDDQAASATAAAADTESRRLLRISRSDLRMLRDTNLPAASESTP